MANVYDAIAITAGILPNCRMRATNYNHILYLTKVKSNR